MNKQFSRSNKIQSFKKVLAATILIAVCIPSFSQDGVAGIEEANTKVHGYFELAAT